jgi:hypothetical protein
MLAALPAAGPPCGRAASTPAQLRTHLLILPSPSESRILNARRSDCWLTGRLAKLTVGGTRLLLLSSSPSPPL